MKLLIVSHVRHRHGDQTIGGYGPYVREMNLWLKHVSAVRVVAPIEIGEFDPIDLAYDHNNLDFHAVPAFDITRPLNALKALLMLPLIVFRLYQAMRWADHIHIRCPGNMGLLGCFVQLLFPGKAKSVKFAANWDLSVAKPWSYRLQQRIAMNPRLSRSMQVMVYGEWPGYTANMRNFFTATYYENEIVPSEPRSLDGQIRLVFVGRLVDGKKPLIAAEVLQCLLADGHDVRLDIYGDGPQKKELERFIASQGLAHAIAMHGNVNKDGLKQALQAAHFLAFPTVMSEGWPKVVAESMFWGCVPVTTAVSCLPYMLGHGSRGAIVNADVESVRAAIAAYLADPVRYAETARSAMTWSQQFTLGRFEAAIVRLLEAGVPHG